MTVHSGGATEQTRVLNFLQMFESGAMGDITQPTTMRALPLMCKTVIDIRKLNRKLLNQLRDWDWRPFKENNYPNENEEVVMQLIGGGQTLAHFNAKDLETFQQEGVKSWLRFPQPPHPMLPAGLPNGVDTTT